MKLNLSIITGKDEPAVQSAPVTPSPAVDPVWEAEAMDLIRKTWGSLNAPDLTSDEIERRTGWVGGAIRVLALATGQDATAIRADLPAIAPGTSSAYAAAGLTVVPTPRPTRPAPHPGAPRRVEPDAPQAEGSPSPPEPA